MLSSALMRKLACEPSGGFKLSMKGATPMNAAIASYAFHGLLQAGSMDVFGYLESCRYRYDLRTADIWNGMLISTEDAYLAKVKRALNERDLELVNLCV